MSFPSYGPGQFIDDVSPEPSGSFSQGIENEAGWGDYLASGALKGIAGLGDTVDFVAKYNPLGQAWLDPNAPSLGAGNAIRSIFDMATGIPQSTEVGKDTLIHKAASYVPAMAMGGSSLLPKAIGGTAKTVLSSLGSLSKLAGLSTISAAGGQYGGQIGEEVGGEKGKIIGDIAGSILPLLGLGTAGSIWQRINKPQEVVAGQKLIDAGLTAEQIPTETGPLSKYATLAEVTQNPQIAQLEDTLLKNYSPASAELVANNAQRQAAQLNLLNEVSGVPEVSAEAGGDALRNLLVEPAAKLEENAAKAYASIKGDGAVPLINVKNTIKSLASSEYSAGGMPGPLKGLLNEIDNTIKGPNVSQNFGYAWSLKKRAQDVWRDAVSAGDGRAARVAASTFNAIDSAVEQAGKSGFLSSSDVDAFKKGNELFSTFKQTYGSGKIGSVLSKEPSGAFKAPGSQVIDKLWDGTPEGTRKILNALPDSESAIESARGSIRDYILRETQNADGNLIPSKFRKFLIENKEALSVESGKGKRLFTEEHIENLQQISDDMALTMPSSPTSRKGLSFAASEGQPTTAQALLQAGKEKGLWATRKIPGLQYVADIFSVLGTKSEGRMNELLTKATFDPEFAKLLLKKASDSSVRSVLDVIGRSLLPASASLPSSVGSNSGEFPEGGGLGANSKQQIGISQSLLGQIAQPQFQQKNEARKSLPIYKPGEFIDDTAEGSATPLGFKQDISMNDTNNTVKDQKAPPHAEKLYKAVTYQETRNRKDAATAVSPKGAIGLMQIMPKTATEIADDLGIEDYDLKDPETNKLFGRYYLNKMYKRFGDTKLALAAYNAGPTLVARILEKTGFKTFEEIERYLPKETREYVPSIMRQMDLTEV